MGGPVVPLQPEEHLEWILAQTGRTGTHVVPLAEAHGLMLAADVHAAHPLPLWDNSAMDGYAVRSIDTAGAPVELEVLGEVPAGSSWDPVLGAGQCVRIMTGAPLPTSADAVVRVEDTQGDAGTWGERSVRILGPVPAGKDVRRAGEDRQAGEVMARTGEQLTAARISSLAAAGIDEVLVHAAPRVAVLVTGSELKVPDGLGGGLERGQIPESNSLLLCGLLAEAGLPAATVRRCQDTVEAVRAELGELSRTHDVVISTGGVGPGTRDVMRLALEDEPGVRHVRVAMRPGQPQCAGTLAGGTRIFALPGNPVSAAASFEMFVAPALRAMQGAARIQRRRELVPAADGWHGAAGRWQVVPVVFTAHGVLPAVHASRISHSVGGFGAAEGYALVPPGTGDIAAGDQVDVLRILPWM